LGLGGTCWLELGTAALCCLFKLLFCFYAFVPLVSCFPFLCVSFPLVFPCPLFFALVCFSFSFLLCIWVVLFFSSFFPSHLFFRFFSIYLFLFLFCCFVLYLFCGVTFLRFSWLWFVALMYGVCFFSSFNELAWFLVSACVLTVYLTGTVAG